MKFHALGFRMIPALAILIAMAVKVPAQCPPKSLHEEAAFEPSSITVLTDDDHVDYTYDFVIVGLIHTDECPYGVEQTAWFGGTAPGTTTVYGQYGSNTRQLLVRHKKNGTSTTTGNGFYHQNQLTARQNCTCYGNPTGDAAFEASGTETVSGGTTTTTGTYYDLGCWVSGTWITQNDGGDYGRYVQIDHFSPITTTTVNGWTVQRATGFTTVDDYAGPSTCSPTLHGLHKAQYVYVHMSITATNTPPPPPGSGGGGGVDGGFPPGFPPGSLTGGTIVNPRWDYSNSSFSGDIINYGTSTATFTVYRSLNQGSTFSSIGSYSVTANSSGSGGMTTFTDSSTSVASASDAIYRIKVGGSCVGQLVGFTVLGTSYTNYPNNYTAHGATLAPAALSMSDIFPPAYDWDVATWTGSGYSFDSFSGGLWDDDGVPFGYQDGFLVKTHSASAPKPRLCGYVPTGTLGRSYSGYTLAASPTLQSYDLTTSGAYPTGPSGGTGTAYRWSFANQSWTSTGNTSTWSSGAWSTNLGFGGSDGIFLYFPTSGSPGNWSRTLSPTCPP